VGDIFITVGKAVLLTVVGSIATILVKEYLGVPGVKSEDNYWNNY